MTLLRLMAARHRLPILCWTALVVGLCGATVSAYKSTYPTEEQRRIAVGLAQHDAATTLMYGHLPDPGTPALMFTWEIGAIVTVLAAVMAVLIAVMLTRAAEDDGTVELVRSCGAAPPAPLRVALVLLTAVAAVLAAGSAAALRLAGSGVDTVGTTGSVAVGAVIGLTFLLFGMLTAVAAQVVPTAGQTRLLGFAVVGVAFAARALADTRDAGWLNRLTPLGLRATVRPFAGDRWPPLAVALLVAMLLAAVAAALSRRREYGAGLLPRRDARDRRFRLRTVAGLTYRLTRSTLLAWTVAVGAITTLFCAMGSGVVQQRDLGGFLGAQVGAGDPVAGYLSYCGTVAGLIVSVFGILGTLAAGRDERAGLTDHVLATGRRRWVPLAARTAVAAGGSALILVTAGTLSAVVAPRVIAGTDVAARAFAYVAGQWPAVAALIGLTALVVGLRPRWGGLAWLPLVAAALVALLGDLLGLPAPIQRLGVFQHVPDVAGAHHPWAGLLVVLAVGAGAALIGLAGAGRRDLVAG